MIYYITFLRALAACLITNAHYTGVYPTDLIANGGLLGDVLFFAVSGFCLYNIKGNFLQWYSKRIIRIYPAVLIITIVYILLGFYTFEKLNIFQYMIYPTAYHFIASIIVLYIVYYIIINNKKISKNILSVIGVTAFIQFIVYIFMYDKSYYHIDIVREPMIEFLFFEAMLIGAYFRQQKDRYINKNKVNNWIIMFILLILYFISKIIFMKFQEISYLQICNQFILIITLFYILKSFSGIDQKLEKSPEFFKNIISWIAKITLEIYLVQYVIIPKLSHIIFPINWIIITSCIISSAIILHFISEFCIRKIEKIILKYKGVKDNANINNRSI